MFMENNTRRENIITWFAFSVLVRAACNQNVHDAGNFGLDGFLKASISFVPSKYTI